MQCFTNLLPLQYTKGYDIILNSGFQYLFKFYNWQYKVLILRLTHDRTITVWVRDFYSHKKRRQLLYSVSLSELPCTNFELIPDGFKETC